MKAIKFLALLLVLAMTLGMFAGCSKEPTNTTPQVDNQSTRGNNSEVEATDAAEDIYTIDFYYAGWGDPTTDISMIENAMNAILEPKIGARVALHPIDNGEWQDKTNLMFNSGKTKYDLISSSAGLQPTLVDASTRGAYMDIGDLLQEYGQDIIAACGQEFINGCRVNGTLYGVPTNKEKGNAYGFAVNTALAEKYGIDIASIKTLDDIEAACAKVTDPGVTALSMSQNNMGQIRIMSGYADWFNAYLTIPYDTTDYKLQYCWDNEKYMDLLRWAHKMYKAGYVNESALTDTDAGPFKSGKALFMPSNFHPNKATELSSTYGFDVQVIQMTEAFTPYNAAQGICLSIGRNCGNPEKTMKFLNLLYSDKELLNTLIYGIEGIHWEFVEGSDNVIKYPDGVTAENIGWGNQGWVIGNQLLDYLREGDDPQKWEKYAVLNASAITTALGGFSGMDTSTFEAEKAAYEAITDKYSKALNCGMLDPDETMATIKAELEAAGFQKVVDECQRQIDEWAVANGKK